MSFIIVDGERYALSIGDTVLGGSGDELLATSPLASLPPFALVSVSPEGTATVSAIRGGPALQVDGQAASEQPQPVRHGSRLEVMGRRIVYGHLQAAGRTAHVADAGDAEIGAAAQLEERPAASSDGRLVRLDGSSSHPILGDGLTIGRDPASDLVLTHPKSSRNHARIEPSLTGYTLIDLSSNGVFVNGTRVDKTHRLGVGDVLRFGNEEFRFEGEAASYEPAAELLPRSSAAAAVGTAPAPAPASSKAPLLATLEVITEGALKGKRFRLERPVAHLGRGVYNDVPLPEDSVSTAHAMLMQRDGKWNITDLGSRNGTYVDGQRVTEGPLPGACELRLGNVRLVFRPLRATQGDDSTRGIVGVS